MSTPATMTVPLFRGEARIEWGEKPVPEPGPGQLLLDVRANALCGTDRLQHRFGSPDAVPGHEAAGVVVEGGSGTTTRPGTAGVVYLMDFCRSCRSCRARHTNQCLNKRGDVGFTRDGGLCPYTVVSEHTFFPIPDAISLSEATLLLDVMGTSRHAIDRAALVRADIERVLVAGAGPIGLGLCAMAPLVLGENVAVEIFDPEPARVALAEKLGAVAVEIDDAGQPVVNEPADIAFDASGRAAARRALVDHLGQRGVLVCVGHGQGLELKVSPDLIATERAVLGSEYFRYAELEQNLRLLQQHRTRLASIITDRFPLTEVEAAFDAFLGRTTGKVVVEQ